MMSKWIQYHEPTQLTRITDEMCSKILIFSIFAENEKLINTNSLVPSTRAARNHGFSFLSYKQTLRMYKKNILQ